HYSVEPADEYTEFYWIHFQTTHEWQENDQAFLQLYAKENQQQYDLSSYTMHLPKTTALPFPEQAYHLIEKMIEAGQERESDAFWRRQQAFTELLWMLDQRQQHYI